MAISRDLLVEARQPLADRILAFLNKTPEQAFTLFEIYAGVEGHPAHTVALIYALMDAAQRARSMIEYRVALDHLTGAGKVEMAEVRGLEHYAVIR